MAKIKPVVKPMYRYTTTIVEIHDGDTMTVNVDLGFHTWIHSTKIRLKGINCPELTTPEGLAALAFVNSVITLEQNVTIDTIMADKYGNRWGAYVYLADGKTLNQLLLDTGHAVVMK